MHINIFPSDCPTHCLACCCTIMVLAIAYCLLEICLDETLHDTWMSAFVVITLKLIHIIPVFNRRQIYVF